MARCLAAGALAYLTAACGLLAPLPEPTTLDQRLAAFPVRDLPLQGRTVIHWDPHQIPYIEAETDADAAFALGLVHAHLRLGQMEILRRVSQGRIAEMAGPLASDIDHGLRLLDFGRAAARMEAALPEETRAWLEAFVEGVNHYQAAMVQEPHEYRVLGLEREPWTVRDLLTFGRMAGTDVNWLVWANILPLRKRDDWPEIWTRLVRNGSDSVPSFQSAGLPRLTEMLAGFSRSGSNSLVISPRRSRSGGAIMANDPHLGIVLPNLWLLAGVKSPSYHAVGLMVPGLPFFAIGRNPWIAWGGTNMRAASSELYDLSEAAPDRIRTREETIAVRWWFDREVALRDTEWGPVISDAPFLEDESNPPFALRWTGHLPSDEVSTMLRVSRARTFAEFRAALESFAVPGQNMLYADVEGNIGQVMAVRLPDRNGPPPGDLVLDPAEAAPAWRDLKGPGDLPFSYNPAKGYLASANNRPTNSDIQIGYFFSPDDQVRRMAEIIEGSEKLGRSDIEALQRDVVMPSSITLRDLFVKLLRTYGVYDEAGTEAREVLSLLENWDGAYHTGSRGAVAFELFRQAFSETFYTYSFGEQDWAAFANVGRIKSLLMEDIATGEPAALRAALNAGLEAATRHIGDFADWGEMHRLGLSHPLGLLPLIGGRYRFADVAIGGSTDTLMKTAHAATDERHDTRYGSNARHISDLADPDANYFVLLGGQDGWLNSSTFLDQLPLWLEGRYVQLPLSLERVRARAVHSMVLNGE